MMDDREFRDITVLYGEDAEAWCTFMEQSFMAEQMKLKVDHLNVSTLDYNSPPEIHVSIQESHVVILLVTDALLTYMEKNAEWLTKMLQSRDPVLTSIFAVCLSVEHEDFLNLGVHFFYDLDAWDEYELSEDGSNVTTLVSRVLGFVDNNGDRLIRKRRMTQKRAENSHQGVQIIPAMAPQAGERTALIFSEEMKGQLTVHLENTSSEPLDLNQTNPYCVTFITPEIDEQDTKLIIKSDDQIKFQIPWSRGCQVCQFTSMELLCQAHGVTTSHDLDLTLTQKFQASQCLEVNERTEYLRDNVAEPERTTYPSMLHWAAAHNLQELVAAILSAAAGSSLGRVANSEGLDPAAMARSNGHNELADFIAHTLETEAIAEACKIYVENAERNTVKKTGQVELKEDTEYETMKPSQIRHAQKYAGTPSPFTPSPFCSPASFSDHSASELPRNIKDPLRSHTTPGKDPSTKFKFPPPPVPPKKKSTSSEPELSEDSNYEIVDATPPPVAPKPGQYIHPSDPYSEDDDGLYLEPDWVLPPGALGSRSQGELINIQRDVKAGAFTFSEAERLFKAWVDRHERVTNQSFKDKMTTLKTLRSEYSTMLATIREREVTPTNEPVLPTISNPMKPRPAQPASGSVTQRDNRYSKASQASSASSDSGIAASDDTEGKRSSRKDLYIKLLNDAPGVHPDQPPALPPRPARRKDVKAGTLPARRPSQQPKTRTYSKKSS